MKQTGKYKAFERSAKDKEQKKFGREGSPKEMARDRLQMKSFKKK